MQMRYATLIIAISAVVATAFDAASAKENKANTTLMKNTATGTHYKNLAVTSKKTKTGKKLTPDKVEAGGENIR
jgi:Flp pilus assembly protein CpaB